MNLKVLCFGITRDIIGQFEYKVSMPANATVADLKKHLAAQFPAFGQLKSLRIALNEAYAEDPMLLNENDEIVLIPPVSGG
ncbi:molybdopterin converting factor subunit 1 [Emticicia sp. TH156]|uniref:molybdopterin converting factor subunit 1 n=1 Tax=Emticicia sp. TH156 TaxID=2067454 RepID=UPI000C75AF3E|nr:molybdopterin converting factor subunit 1 [Emticicia sp. TH156]PLK44158.1 molybdopterin converting factor subunit 1 [Emticicia sp. TH156]